MNIKKRKRHILLLNIFALLLLAAGGTLSFFYMPSPWIYIGAFFVWLIAYTAINQQLARKPLPAERIQSDHLDAAALFEILSTELERKGFRKIEDIPFEESTMTVFYRLGSGYYRNGSNNARAECYSLVRLGEAVENSREAEASIAVGALLSAGLRLSFISLTSVLVVDRPTSDFAERVTVGLTANQKFKHFCAGMAQEDGDLLLTSEFGLQSLLARPLRRRLLARLGFGKGVRGELVDLSAESKE